MHTPWDNKFGMFGCGLRCTWCRSSIAFHRLRYDTLCKRRCFHDSVHRASRKDSSTLNAIHRFSGSTVNLWNLVTRNSMFPSCLLANCATKKSLQKRRLHPQFPRRQVHHLLLLLLPLPASRIPRLDEPGSKKIQGFPVGKPEKITATRTQTQKPNQETGRKKTEPGSRINESTKKLRCLGCRWPVSCFRRFRWWSFPGQELSKAATALPCGLCSALWRHHWASICSHQAHAAADSCALESKVHRTLLWHTSRTEKGNIRI